MKIAIIGGGLAGTFLARELLNHKDIEVILFDSRRNSASRISAGIVNVITGMNFSLSWKAKTLVEKLQQITKDEVIGQHFTPKMIYRPFPSVLMMNKVYEKTLANDYKYFVEINNEPVVGINNPFGGIKIKNLGFFKVAELLNSLQEYLQENHKLKIYNKQISYGEIVVNNSVRINGETFDKIVFAEGVGIFKNPFFKSNKISPLKGETITVRLPNFNSDDIIIKKVYIIPIGNNLYNIGSTYLRGVIDFATTDEAREYLLEKLFAVIGEQPYEVVKHSAGVRVTTYDRRFFIGSHPEFKNIYFFNGLGTKGLLQSPYGAEILARNILYGVPIEKEVSVERFFE